MKEVFEKAGFTIDDFQCLCRHDGDYSISVGGTEQGLVLTATLLQRASILITEPIDATQLEHLIEQLKHAIRESLKEKKCDTL